MFIYVSVRVVSVAVKEIFVHMDTNLSDDRQSTYAALARITCWFTGFIPTKTKG